jgi:hypothetical protein
MPFRTFVREGVLNSRDLDILQGVYDEATASYSSIDDATMHRVVNSLIRHYQAGARDRHWLIRLTESELCRAVG